MIRQLTPRRPLGRHWVTYLTHLFLIALGACSDSASGPGFGIAC
jgi:hypothetical protein